MKGVVTFKMNRHITIKKIEYQIYIIQENILLEMMLPCFTTYWYVNAQICMSTGYPTIESIVFKCRYNGTTTPLQLKCLYLARLGETSAQHCFRIFSCSWLLDIPMGLAPFTIQLISTPDLPNSNKEDLTSTNM